MQYDLGVDLDGIEWVQGAVNSVIRRSTSRRTEAASRLAISWRPARSTPLLAPICRACSTVTPTRAAISRLSRARAGLFPAHPDLPDHALDRRPQRYLRAPSVRGDQFTRPSAPPRIARARKCGTPARSATFRHGCRPISRNSTRFSAATAGPQASSRTDRRLSPW